MRTLTQNEQRIRLLDRLEKRMIRMDGTLGRLHRLRNFLTPLLTRLRTGEDPGVIEAELRRRGFH